MIWLISGVVVALIVAVSYGSYRLGKINLLKEQAQASVGVKDEQIKAVVNRPSKPDLVNKLRSGDF